MTQIRMTCPVCEKEREVYFDDEFLEDDSFVQAMTIQPWKIVCESCEAVLKPFFETCCRPWGSASFALQREKTGFLKVARIVMAEHDATAR